jgi:transposase-like protein
MYYHANATTNCNQRQLIKDSQDSYRTLATQFQVSLGTIHNWKHAPAVADRSCAPHTVHYALTEYEQQLVCGIRQMEWHSSQDIVLLLSHLISGLNLSNCYRTLVRAQLNVSDKPKPETKEFKQYEPGYIHIDLFYLPKLNGERRYVYVAIDRATRMVYLNVKPDKSAVSSLEFIKEVIAFFPFTIYRILTDNGKEFTLAGYKGRYGKTTKIHDVTVYCWSRGIEHHTTKVKHPWTNGMVERMNKTLQDETVKRFRYEHPEEIVSHLKLVQDHWNYYKKHKVLGLKTIPQILTEWHNKKPNIFRVSYYQLPFTKL